jgi:hypothetical protein
LFEIFFYLGFVSLFVSIGALVWYFVRGRPRGALWVAILSFVAAPVLVVTSFVGFLGDEDDSITRACECPAFAEAVAEIAWISDAAGLLGTPLVEGSRATVTVSFDPQAEAARRRLVDGLVRLGAAPSDPSGEVGAPGTPLLGLGRTEVRAFWGSDFLRVQVNTDASRLDRIDVDLEPVRAVFGTVDDPLPVIDSG